MIIDTICYINQATEFIFCISFWSIVININSSFAISPSFKNS